MLGDTITAKFAALLAKPEAMTITLPVVAPAGTGRTILVALQLVGVPAVPLNVTVLMPWEAPKLFPVMVTDVPTGLAVGLRLVILGAIPNISELLDTPDTTAVTTTVLNADRLLGIIATTLVSLQLVTVAASEPTVRELAP